MNPYKIFFVFILLLGFSTCTKDFEEMNKNPNAILQEEASARYFVTNPLFRLYAPDRYPGSGLILHLLGLSPGVLHLSQAGLVQG